jgi:hypothetical protein
VDNNDFTAVLLQILLLELMIMEGKTPPSKRLSAAKDKAKL